MNAKQTIKANISGILTDEFQPTTDVIEACKDLYGLGKGTVTIMMNTMVRDGFVEAKDGEVRLIKEFEVPETPETPVVTAESPKARRGGRFVSAGKPRPAKWGKEQQVVGGEIQDYTRNEFDGQITALDEEHLILKEDMLKFKAELRKLIWNLDGVGENAFVFYDPQTSTRKDGKVFFRWNGEKTAEKMDELKPFIEEAKKLRNEGVKEEGQ